MNRKHLYRFGQGILVVLLILLIAPSFSGPAKSNKSFDEIAQAAFEGVDMTGYPARDALAVKRYLGADPSQFEQIVLYRTDNAMDAQEVVLAKYSSEEARKAFSDLTENRKESQAAVFEGYAPDQYAQMQEARISAQGNYGIYAAGPQAEQIVSQFEKEMKVSAWH